MKEIWKNIPGYNGKYQANTEGQIRRVYPSGKTRLVKAFIKTIGKKHRLLVKLSIEGKRKERSVLQLMAKTFLGPATENYVAYHKNGCYRDNYIQNIAYMSNTELGRKNGGRSRRKPVAKINSMGEIVDVYSSAREAGRKNYMSYQTIIGRCNGKCKSAFAPDGYAYAWDDKEVSMRNALRKIELENGYMPKALKV